MAVWGKKRGENSNR